MQLIAGLKYQILLKLNKYEGRTHGKKAQLGHKKHSTMQIGTFHTRVCKG